MTSRCLLDTDIFSEVLRRKDAFVIQHFQRYRLDLGRLILSTLTVLEIVKGFVKQGLDHRVAGFLSLLEHETVVGLDLEAAALAGTITARLEQSGQPIGKIDPMIAAIALRLDLPLVTGNVEHYIRIRNLGFLLRIINWRLESPDIV